MSGPVTALDRHVGLLIAKKRRARGWSQAELAKRSGVSRGVISVVECGRSRVFLEHFLKIGGAFQPRAKRGA